MRCGRCAGLVVADHFIGGTTSTGGWAYGGWRCVNCGAIDFSRKTGVPPDLRGVTGGEKSRQQRHVPSTKFRRHE